jgi:ribosomal protein L37E
MSKATCTISEDGKTITCHRCGRTSHNPNDVAFHYCGHCNHWHDGADNLLNAGAEAAVMNKTATICKFR